MTVNEKIFPKGKENYDDGLCTHIYAKVLDTQESIGPAIGGKTVRVVWQYITCPDCRTEKVLVK